MAAVLTALLMAAGFGVVAAGPAAADNFPILTFKIVDSAGNCIEADLADNAVIPETCGLLNLNQQWTYNTTTHQLANVGQAGCIENESDSLTFVTCAAIGNQEWYRFAASGGGWNISNANSTNPAFLSRVHYYPDGIYRIEALSSPDPTAKFTFPLI